MTESKKKFSKKKIVAIVVWLLVFAALIVGIVLTDPLYEQEESVSEVMEDAVLHESNKADLFGMQVNPAVISGFVQTRKDKFPTPQFLPRRVHLRRGGLYFLRHAV